MKPELQEPQVGVARANWSGAYWILAINQWLVLGGLTYLSAEIVRMALEACTAFQIQLPVLSQMYMVTLGPSGLAISGMLAMFAIAALAFVRTRLVAVIMTSAVFLVATFFLTFALVWSFFPIWYLIDSLARDVPPL